ncbi:hypothetical protein ZYGR_0AK02870 [Zygosaccharomyces rouxii]|uniref:Subtelomeric hrmA-associated cluster protein AFUB-079030/YDR124W-like helical bundle domain-containing protein n=1 Tax=Zygosaccharomyces rouxii TaxID=4956 RepID=A0A1Q3ADU0_ZYGRO|nr:hypothetical protein ZYGR_0AK02870 [Zygosaccharomyces rouxii]
MVYTNKHITMMSTNKFNEIAVFLLKEGYEFSIFVKDKIDSRSNCKFSQAYVTTAVEDILPIGVWDLVDSEKIIKYDSKLCAPQTNYPTIALPLKNLMVVEKYIHGALKLLRQVPCKAIAKAWIKAIEPRKKTKYPYIRGDIAKPSWWPHDVEHREPDHLQKADRLKLMCRILISVLPEIGCLEVVEELLRSTFALSLFKKDPDKDNLISSIFEIPKILCNPVKLEQPTVEVIDLSYFKRRCKAANPTVVTTSRDIHRIPHAHQTTEATQTPPSTAPRLMSHFENCNLSPPVLIDLLVENDPDLDSYIDVINIASSSSSKS